MADPNFEKLAEKANAYKLASLGTTAPPATEAFSSADIESAKKAAAIRAVGDHFDPSAKYVGIGSGTTIVYVVEAIKNLNIDVSTINFVPTGYQSRQVIVRAGLTPASFTDLPAGILMDVAFDGADEIDADLNCIKGGGACLYQEKLVATHAKKFICVADHRKLQDRLLTNWPTIPIEVEPQAVRVVEAALRELGSPNPQLRESSMQKAGPVKTDQGFYIVDAPFEPLMLQREVDKALSLHPAHQGATGMGEDGKWEVKNLARAIKMIEGVLSVGIFSGENGEEIAARGVLQGGQKPVAAYFGMPDGSVVSRKAGHEPEELKR